MDSYDPVGNRFGLPVLVGNHEEVAEVGREGKCVSLR